MEPYWRDGLMDPVKLIVQRTPHQLLALQHVGYSGRWPKVGEDLLTPEATEHQPRDTSTVLTVFETFASNNMRKQALRSLAKIYHVATINPWSDTAITFNASDEPKFRIARAPAALVLSPIVDGFCLTKVLMDGGSGLNLIYEETLQKIEIDWNRIE